MTIWGLLSIFFQAFFMSQKIFESNNIWTLQTFPRISEQFRLDILVTPGALSARSVRPPPSSPTAAAVSHCPLTASGQQTRMTGVAKTGHVMGHASAHAKLLASCFVFFLLELYLKYKPIFELRKILTGFHNIYATNCVWKKDMCPPTCTRIPNPLTKRNLGSTQ